MGDEGRNLWFIAHEDLEMARDPSLCGRCDLPLSAARHSLCAPAGQPCVHEIFHHLWVDPTAEYLRRRDLMRELVGEVMRHEGALERRRERYRARRRAAQGR